MKKILALIFGTLFMFSTSLCVAVTLEGHAYLKTQAEVNAFNYTEVTGMLDISGDDISDLSPLNMLTSIGEYIYIGYNPSLIAVSDFLPALTNVGTGIYIYDNPNLVVFDGFHNLVTTGDNIDVWYNDSLETLSGFENLVVAGWTIEIGGNPVLTSIPQYESLHTISSSLFILDNPMLTEVTGFNALNYVDWSFQIGGNSSLNNLCGFYNYFVNNNPYTGDGYFNIFDNGPGLPNPTSIQDVIDNGACIKLKNNKGKKPDSPPGKNKKN